MYSLPANGKAGKFLDEERQLKEYPFPGPVGALEVSAVHQVDGRVEWSCYELYRSWSRDDRRGIKVLLSRQAADRLSAYSNIYLQLYSPNGSNIKTTNNLTKHNKLEIIE